MADNLTRSTVGGFKWTYGSLAVTIVLQIIFTAAMARLLDPSDFGVLAMALVFIRFGGYFARMGVGQALIQKPNLTEVEVGAGFASTAALGALFTLVLVGAAPFAAALFDDADVVPIARAMALTFTIQGLGIAANSLLRRKLRFRAVAVIEIVAYALGYVGVGLAAAMLGAGVWSFVAAALAQASMSSALSYALEAHPIRVEFKMRDLSALYSFGGKVTAISLLEFVGSTLDTVFIGRFAGQASLGQYNRGQQLVNLPLERVTQGMTRVLFPALSAIQQETERLRRTYLSAVRIIAVLVIPAGAGMAAAAFEIVTVVLGPGWNEAARVLPFLAMLAALNLLCLLPAIICEARAVLNAKFLVQVFHLVVLASLLSLSVGRSLTAYAIAGAAAQLVRLLGYALIMRGTIGVRLKDVARMLMPVVLTAGVVAAAIVMLSIAGRASELGPFFTLVLQCSTGGVLLGFGLYFGPLKPVRADVYHRLTAARLLDTSQRGASSRVERVIAWRLGSSLRE